MEIECNRITRAAAAQAVARCFGAEQTHTAGRRGSFSCSIRDAQGREWRFQKDSSIRGPDREKCEMITPVLRYEDMELLQEAARSLRRAGAKSSPSEGCGVHIHIGLNSPAGDHNAKTLRNLVNMMAAHEEQLARAIRLDTGRKKEYCRAVCPTFVKEVNRAKPESMEAMAEIWYRTNGTAYSRDARYNASRYHMLNLHAAFTKGTIEFRLFQFDEANGRRRGGLHAGELKAYIQLCLAMSEKAKEITRASFRPPQTENDKYALRTWLLRLGFVGEEFRTARRLLLRNMAGNGARRR